MKEEIILKQILDGILELPEAVELNVVESNGVYIYEIKVSQDDMGRLIGKSGANIKAITTIMMAVASKNSRKIRLVVKND